MRLADGAVQLDLKSSEAFDALSGRYVLTSGALSYQDNRFASSHAVKRQREKAFLTARHPVNHQDDIIRCGYIPKCHRCLALWTCPANNLSTYGR